MSFRRIHFVLTAVALGLSTGTALGSDFSIAEFGARTDGTLCTRAIEGAMAACEKAGGGRVVVPKGRWLTGAIRFRSNCELFLSEGAEVLFSQKPADYLPAVHTSWEGIECWNYCPLVYAYCCTNVAITGTGALLAYEGEWSKTAWYPWVWQDNGVGAARRRLYDWGATNAPVELRQIWKMKNANTRPHFVQFNRCKNVRWDGFKVRNSPFWTLHLYLCDGVEVRGLDVCAHGNNNDGIDIEMSRNVIVENCTFDQGDDGVVIKSGRNQDAWRLHTPTENVLIRNCYIKNAHTVLGVGSEISGGVRNVRMENCRAETPHRVFYLKTNHRRGGFLENITCENVTCREASESVFEIDTDVLYEWAKFPDYKIAITRISDITARNISVGTVKDVVRLKGDARLPPRNIVAEGLVVDKVTDVWQDVKNVDGFSHVATAAPGASALAQVVQANCGKCAKTEYERYYAELEAADKAADSAWDTVADRAQFDARRRALREKFLSDVGAFPERTPLAARVVATVPRKGYRVEKVLFESRPGFHVPALVYVPDAVRFAPPYPAVLVTCGHSENGKACADYQRACVMGANEGFLMMICDPIDQGERLMSTDGSCCGGHNQFGAKAHGLGLSAAHFRIWDGMRCLDYLQSRPDVKADRLGVMGNSGGGTMTALIAAADPRVKAAAPSCYITTIRDVVRTIGPQDAEQCVWRQLKDGINHASLVLMAEAAVRLQFSDNDFFPIAGARSTYDIVRRTAERVGLGTRYSATVVRGPHGWKESSRRSSLDWMRQWLMDEKPSGRTDADYVALDGMFDAATADCGLSDAEAKVAPGGSVLNLPGERTVSDLLVDHAIGAKTPRLVFRETVPPRHSFYGAKSVAEENAVICLMLGKNLVEERTKEILAQARARMARGEPKPVLVAEDAWIKPAERAFAKAPELFVGFCPLGEGVFRTSVRDSEGGVGTEKAPLKILMINSF